MLDTASTKGKSYDVSWTVTSPGSATGDDLPLRSGNHWLGRTEGALSWTHQDSLGIITVLPVGAG